MGLMSFFKRHNDDSSGAAPAPDAVANARTRARRRLIGATVLLGIGVIGFPLLFETQPRPVPVDIPIEIPRRDGVPPLPMPPVQAPPPVAATPLPTTPSAEAPASRPAASPVITERATEQGREVATAAPVRPAASVPRPAASAPRAAASSARPASAPVVAAANPDDGQRARALLEGKPAAAKPADAAASAPRVIVQVGAYTDADKLREARQKVEKLGLKTYTQVVEAEGAKRTRVRVGPFATREEADKVAARIKAAGLPVAVLNL